LDGDDIGILRSGQLADADLFVRRWAAARGNVGIACSIWPVVDAKTQRVVYDQVQSVICVHLRWEQLRNLRGHSVKC
jgi:hypothetical protein